MTFDLDLWSIDLTINRDHLLIKDYLPTKFEAPGAKRCWVIRCTRFGRLTWSLTLTFDLLTWLSIGIIYSSRTTYQVWSLWGKALLSYPLHKVWETDMTFDLDLWPTDPTINRDHLLIKDYLPTKFEACGAKRSGVISCTRFERLTWPLTLTFDLLTWLSIGIIYLPRTTVSTYQVWSLWGKAFWNYQLHKVKGDRHTDRPTYRPTCATQYAPPSSKGGITPPSSKGGA